MGLYAADGRARLYLHPRREMVEDRGNHSGFPNSSTDANGRQRTRMSTPTDRRTFAAENGKKETNHE